MEVMGNVLDNACKYCLEFVEVSVRQTTDSHLHILVEDDGPGIPSQRRAVFDRGQRADTLRPGRWGSPSPGKSSNNMTGRSSPARACSAAPAWRWCLAAS